MSYQLKTDEILEALVISEHPNAQTYITAIESVANVAATALAQHLGIVAGTGDFQGIGFAGLCVPFHPKTPGQPLPDALDGFDDPNEWDDTLSEPCPINRRPKDTCPDGCTHGEG